MARSVQEYYDLIVSIYVQKAAQDGILSADPATWGLLNRRRLWANVMALALNFVNRIFDTDKAETAATIAADKAHTPGWYVGMAKKFQYGYNLVPGKDYYDNTGLDESLVAASKIIAYAACVEEPYTRMKVAKLVGNNLAKLSDPELTAFITGYIKRIKDAGVRLKDDNRSITSSDPDKLYLKLTIVINPLVLNLDGSRKDGTAAAPVTDAIRNYLSNQNLYNFNGLFDLQKLVDAIQLVDGVDTLNVDNVMSKYALLAFTPVYINFYPDSGYVVIDDVDLDITYKLP